MTKDVRLIRDYRALSAADTYVIGFIYDKKVYMLETAEIMPRFIKVERESAKNGGRMALRFRLTNSLKEQLIRKGAECIGDDTLINDAKYNKGEAFERIVTEKYGQVWEKDNLPFWAGGDIHYNGTEIQVKFENATIVTERAIENAKKAVA